MKLHISHSLGTFCDVFATFSDESSILFKVLSQDPAYPDAPTEGVRRVLEHATGKHIPRGQKLDVSSVTSLRMGTTVATNALLERKGERTALLGRLSWLYTFLISFVIVYLRRETRLQSQKALATYSP